MIDYWVTLELSRLGEKERPEDLEELLRSEVPDKELDIFIPAASFYRRENAVTVCVLEGYAFVRGGYPANFYFEFESSPYIAKVLSLDDRGARYLQYVPEAKIQELRQRLLDQTVREIEEGDFVEITDGAYQNLKGHVVGLSPDGEKAYISIEGLVSLDTYVELPLQFVKKVDE